MGLQTIILEKLQLLAESFQRVLYEEDATFLENMKTGNLAGDDLQRYVHWEWTQGVGLFGFWKLFQNTGEKKYLDILTEYYDRQLVIGLPQMNVNTVTPLLALSYLAEYTGEEKYMRVCEEQSAWIIENFPRTKEGGFCHRTSDSENAEELWDDTLFMTVLFLANMGRILKIRTYMEEAEYQFLLHAKYLTDRTTGLWYHGWTFAGNHNFAGALWGRGNSWITAAIPLFLEIDTQCPPAVRRVLIQSLQRQAEALLRYQDMGGMWHTLVDDATSYLEASATCGFAFGLLKAVHMGLLSNVYTGCSMKALQPILECIQGDGTVEQVSYGTPMGRESKNFYKQIPLQRMPYGQALAMLFLMEISQEKAVERALRKTDLIQDTSQPETIKSERHLVIFWDSGDTIVEEVTEVRDEQGIVVSAELHEGCAKLLRKLYEEGFRMALVADGEVDSFKNIYRQHGLESVFETRAVSEALPERKPAAVMFQTALDGLGLEAEDKARIVMIGNHLMRDVGGANRFGITSIFFDWTTRYSKEPQNLEEVPDYTAHTAEELYELLHRLDGNENQMRK